MRFCLMIIIALTSVYTLYVFFKQKTAYEMRISDWSSDVCSSDLAGLRAHLRCASTPIFRVYYAPRMAHRRRCDPARCRARRASMPAPTVAHRSEEHTSELQSLMRISYAVFCLKTQKNNKKRINTLNKLTNKL